MDKILIYSALKKEHEILDYRDQAIFRDVSTKERIVRILDRQEQALTRKVILLVKVL